MEVCFVGGAGYGLKSRGGSIGRKCELRVKRSSAVVIALFGLGSKGKAKVEVAGGQEVGVVGKEKLIEQMPPAGSEDTVPKNDVASSPPWANISMGKVFFAISLTSLVYSFVKNLRNGVKPNAKSKDFGTTTSFSGNGVSSSKTAMPLGDVSSTVQTKIPVATGWAGQKATPLKHRFDSDATDLLTDRMKKYILVGGKGGVGKTSMSAALATRFADNGQSTLIISTDPAHSLSDSFGVDLSGGTPTSVVGIDNLYAQEINPDEIKSQINLLSKEDKAAMMPGMMGEMGLDDLDNLFETLPPGFDEAVALVEIIKLIQGDPAYQRYDRIVFDTAPTGHTLRLLALPDFMDSFLGKILSMKAKFGSMMNNMKSMLGGGGADGLDTKELDEMKKSMQIVRDLFKDERQTEFIVATIPNMMAISESTRLIDELRKESIPVHYVFVNQIQPENDHCLFCSTRRKEQQANLAYVEKTFANMKLSKVQFFDREIRGSFALRAMGSQLLQTDEEKKKEEAEKQAAAEKAAKVAATTETSTAKPNAEEVMSSSPTDP